MVKRTIVTNTFSELFVASFKCSTDILYTNLLALDHILMCPGTVHKKTQSKMKQMHIYKWDVCNMSETNDDKILGVFK